MKKRVLAIILALTMVLSLIPGVAFADGEPDGTQGNPWLVSTESGLRTALETGGYIKLNESITINNPTTDFSVENDSVLDLNGNSITFGANSAPSGYAYFEVNSGKKLTITGNGTIKAESWENLFIVDGSTIDVIPNGGTIDIVLLSKSYIGIKWNNGTINYRDNVRFNVDVNSKNYIDINNYKCEKIDDWYVISSLPVICTVNGTEYKTIAAAMTAAKVGGVITYPIILTDNASYDSSITENYTFEGNDYTLTITYTYDTISAGTYNCNVSSQYTINGGTFNGSVTVPNGKIEGGTFSALPTESMLASNYGTVNKDGKYFVAKSINITDNAITGGLYYNDPSAYVASGYTVLSRDTAPKYFVTPESNVKNGKIFKGVYYGDSPKTDFLADGYKTGTVKDSGSNTCYIVGKNVSVSNNKVIGGIFAEDPSAFVDKNTFNVTENEGEWTVTLKAGLGAAKIGNEEYATVANAITAANNGDTIVLQKNIIDEQISFSSAKQLTFDLQNYHVANSNGRGMYVSGGSGCVITIKGGAESYISGSTSAVETSSSYTQLVFGEEFLGKVETTIKKSGGTITIKGGLYKTGVSIDNFLDITRGTDTTSVEGYTKVVPLTAENADCAVITAGGEETYYRLTSNNSLNISNAWSAADGNTLKLLKDTPTIGYFEADPGSGKSLVLDLNGKKITNNSTYAVNLQSGTLTVQGNGTIDASGTGASYGIQACNGTTLNITNGTIIGKYNAVYGNSSSAVTVNINGGTLTKGLSVTGSGSTANINGGTFTGYCYAINGATLNVYAGDIESISSNSYQNSIVNIYGGNVGNSQNCGTTNVSGGYVKDKFYTNPSYQGIKFNLTGGEYGFDPSSYISDTEHYSAEVVTEGERWKVVQKGVTKPGIVQYLEGESTETFTLTENIDISDYAYSFTSVGTKTIDLNGHTLTVKHDIFNVGGTLNVTNSSETQGAVIEPDEVLEGYNRGNGSTITVNSSGELKLNGNIRVYGNANAISAMANSKLNITGAEVEANYNAAIAMFNGAEATIKDATIVSHSSSTLNGHTVWSYAIRADAVNGKLTINNSTVTGVQGAIGISQSGFVADITNCTLTAKHTAGKTDCHAALYVATNAVANVYNTKMHSDRANYAAFSGNNDTTEDYGIINLYDGCLLSDKYYKQSTKAYGDPAEGCAYVEASEEEKTAGYNWKVQSTKTYVAQIGDVEYTTLQEALTAAADATDSAKTVVLLKDVAYEEPLTVSMDNKNIILDLNSHTVSANIAVTAQIGSKLQFTVKNSNYDNEGQIIGDVSVTNGKLSIQSSTKTVDNVRTVYKPTIDGDITLTAIDQSSIQGEVTGTLTLVSSAADHVTISNTADVNEIVIEDGALWVGSDSSSGDMAKIGTISSSGGTVKINGGKFTNAGTLYDTNVMIGGGTFAEYLDIESTEGENTVNISGGTFNNGVLTDNTINTISGGSFIGTEDNDNKAFTADSNSLTISGGSFNGLIETYETNVSITDGTFEGAINLLYSIEESEASASISGGKFKCTFGEGEPMEDYEFATKFISGGHFSSEPAQALIVEGKKAIEDAQEYKALGYNYTIGNEEYVAQIGETKYETLEKAVEAANAGDTVTLLTDVTITKQLNIDKAITLDGDGKTITRTSGGTVASDKAGILVTAEATIKNLTVSGPNGTTSGWDEGEFGIKCYKANATLNNVTVTGANAGIQVNGGSVTMTGMIDVSGNEFGGIEVCHSGVLDLTGATLKCDDEADSKPVLWNDDTKGTITYGTQILGKKALGDSKDHYYLYVAKIGEIKYESLAAAIEAVPVGGTTSTEITMLCDVVNATGLSVPSGKNFIVDFAGHTYTVNKPGAGSTGTTTQAFQLIAGSTVVFKNGTIDVAQDNLTPATVGKNIKRLIQNYANLTLENMTLDGTNLYVNDSNTNRAVIETANGNVNITGSTSIKGKTEGSVRALNVDTWKGSYNGGSKVVINTTGTVDEIYLYSEGTATTYTKSSLAIKGGKFVSVTGDSSNDYTSAISGGYFKNQVDSKYIAAGYECVTNPDYNVSEKDTKDYQYMVRSKIVIPVDDGPSAGNIEVQIDTESEQKAASVDETKVTGDTEREVATEIIGKINGSGSGENKSEVVDLTKTVGNFLSKIDLDEVKEIAKATDTKHETTKVNELNNLLTNAKQAAQTKNVEVTMNVTTDVDVKVVGVTVEESEKTEVTRFALDITPYYTLTVTSTIEGEAQPNTVQIVTEGMKEKLDVPETTTVTFPAPDGFVYTSGMSLFVIHTKENGEKFTYPATYNSGTKMISFTNPNGFSEFEVITSSVLNPIAQNVQTEKFYTDLKEALSEAEASGENQTVIILKDLTTANSLKQGTLEVAPNVTLDLNGYDLEAKTVLAWGLVKNNRGSAPGKLIIAKDSLLYTGIMTNSSDYVLPVWDTNGYVFCAISGITNPWENVGNNAAKYWVRPNSTDISKVFAEGSGIGLLVKFEYIGTDSKYHDMTVRFGRELLKDLVDNYNVEKYGLYVTLLGTQGITDLKAQTFLAKITNESINSYDFCVNGNKTLSSGN